MQDIVLQMIFFSKRTRTLAEYRRLYSKNKIRLAAVGIVFDAILTPAALERLTPGELAELTDRFLDAGQKALEESRK